MKEKIAKLIENALVKAKEANNWPASTEVSADKSDFSDVSISVEYPKNEQFGDYTSNIAMILAKKVGKSPMEIAGEIAKKLNAPSSGAARHLLPEGEGDLNEAFEKIEVVAPGYLNFYVSKTYLQSVIEVIQTEQENFGNLTIGKGDKINNEFISANPTGPLHLGNGRGGFYGDSLTRILRKAGYDVTSEYYVNDAGEQVLKLGHSVLKDDEAVYGGDYIDELSAQVGEDNDVKAVGQKAANYILENIIKKTTKEKMQIGFDIWMSEKKLYEDGFVDRAIALLKEKGLAYEKEQALWLRTTEFGDDKDRVLVKSNGQKTYFASDCGYILNKIERGFQVMIESWGADHHGYIQRFEAAAKALDFTGQLKFVIVQLVKLVKDGKEVRMSKRAGNVVYIDDLIAEIGHDVTRFFFLMYSPDTHMNFDLGLATEQSQKNPVFYVQYAHARICSIIAKAQEAGIKNQELRTLPTGRQVRNQELLVHEKELSLLRELNKFPELIAEVSDSYEVHRLPHYAIKLADKFHSFYAACKVIDEQNKELTAARLMLVDAARIVLGETLSLIGVSAPEKM